MTNNWQQGALVDLEIVDLNRGGEGVGKLEGRVVFVPDTVPGDRVKVRLLKVTKDYARGKLDASIAPSCHRIRPRCIVADKCGGCQWQHIDLNYQLLTKQKAIKETLQRVGGFVDVRVEYPLATEDGLGYRNKSTYPLARSSAGQVQAGYYRQGSHQLINLNQCPVQDNRLNPLLAEIKQDIQAKGWSIYNEKTHQGRLRHLSLRIGRRTGEILMTLVSTVENLPELQEQAEIWLQRYPHLVGIALNYNPERHNIIFGPTTRCIAGRDYLRETFAGLELRLRADTFFQINTEVAEQLLLTIIERLNLQGEEVLLDAYCGVGTFTLPLARRVKRAIGIESQSSSIEQAWINANLNDVTNVEFLTGKVESVLARLDCQPELVVLDPPRQGCDRLAINSLLVLLPEKIVYISCDPSTLARDLKLLCASGNYQLVWIQPADFFPQTSHIECAVLLEKIKTNN